MNTNKMASFRLHTGGARGSDAYWQKKMESRGFETVVYSFEGIKFKTTAGSSWMKTRYSWQTSI